MHLHPAAVAGCWFTPYENTGSLCAIIMENAIQLVGSKIIMHLHPQKGVNIPGRVLVNNGC